MSSEDENPVREQQGMKGSQGAESTPAFGDEISVPREMDQDNRNETPTGAASNEAVDVVEYVSGVVSDTNMADKSGEIVIGEEVGGASHENTTDTDVGGTPDETAAEVEIQGASGETTTDMEAEGTSRDNDSGAEVEGTSGENVFGAEVEGASGKSDSGPEGEGTSGENAPDAKAEEEGTPDETASDVKGQGTPDENASDADGEGAPDENASDAEGEGAPDETASDAEGDGAPDENASVVECEGSTAETASDVKGEETSYETAPETKFDDGYEEIDADIDHYVIRMNRISDELKRIELENGKKTGDILKKARSDFKRWKNYLVSLNDSFENLHYDLIAMIEDEERYISRPRQIVCFPMDMNQKKESLEALLNFGPRFMKGSGAPDHAEQLKKRILGGHGAKMRTANDLDYFITGKGMSTEALVQNKNALNTILLILKNFLKTKKELSKTMAYALEKEDIIYEQVKFLAPESLLASLQSDNEELLEETLAGIALNSKFNHEIAMDAREASLKLREKYFSTITGALIRAFNQNEEARRYYENLMKTDDDITAGSTEEIPWNKILSGISKLMENYLADELRIVKIPCARNDVFNVELHNPIIEAEPDKELKNDRIKRVVNAGFIWRPEKPSDEEAIVVKPVDVIVVKNN